MASGQKVGVRINNRAVQDEKFSSAFSVVTKVKNWCLFIKTAMLIYKLNVKDILLPE